MQRTLPAPPRGQGHVQPLSAQPFIKRSIRQRGQIEPIFAERVEAVPGLLCDIVGEGDVVITQGAGDIARLARELCSTDFSTGAGA